MKRSPSLLQILVCMGLWVSTSSCVRYPVEESGAKPLTPPPVIGANTNTSRPSPGGQAPPTNQVASSQSPSASSSSTGQGATNPVAPEILTLSTGATSSLTNLKSPEKLPPPVKYHPEYDKQFEQIFNLADEGHWEEAEALANALYARDPQDPLVARVKDWISTERMLIRARAVEDRIRAIDAKNSAFNPTIKRLLTENKDRGLPPRKDVRRAVEQIEATPYIPDSYGKTNYVKSSAVQLDEQGNKSHMEQLLNKRVTIHLDDATLEDIIFNIGKSEGINFVADKGLKVFQQKISAHLENVTLREFFDFLYRNYGLQFQVGDDLIWIVDAKDPNKRFEQTKFYHLKYGFILPAQFGPETVHRTTQIQKGGVRIITEQENLNRFVNDLAPPIPAIETAIKEFFQGKYLIDYAHNVIVARGTPEQLRVMDQIVKEFDRPVKQVLIEARFVTVSKAALLKLGVAWETGRRWGTTEQQAIDYTGFSIGTPALPIAETFTNILNRRQLSATLTMLQQSGESQLLSAPRLLVVNNLPATISDGKVQYYYEEYQVKQQILERRSSSALVPSGRPTQLTAGANLKVLASIGGDGRTILLALNPEINSDVKLTTFATITDKDDQGNVVSTFDIKLPEYRTQKLATRVVLRSGETVVLGGVLERNQTTFVESVPVLGSLPVIGALFRRRTELDQPRYLLIFVTATIVDENGEFVVYQDEKQTASPASAPSTTSTAGTQVGGG